MESSCLVTPRQRWLAQQGAVNSQAKWWADPCGAGALKEAIKGMCDGGSSFFCVCVMEEAALMAIAIAVGSRQQSQAVKAAPALWGSGPKFRIPAVCPALAGSARQAPGMGELEMVSRLTMTVSRPPL